MDYLDEVWENREKVTDKQMARYDRWLKVGDIFGVVWKVAVFLLVAGFMVATFIGPNG